MKLRSMTFLSLLIIFSIGVAHVNADSKVENELETIEERLEEISAAMLETNDVAELSDLQKELDDLSVSQEALMEEWSDLSEQLEG